MEETDSLPTNNRNNLIGIVTKGDGSNVLLIHEPFVAILLGVIILILIFALQRCYNQQRDQEKK